MSTDSTTIDLLTVQEVADLLGVAKSTVEVWIYEEGCLPSFRKGKIRKVNRADLAQFVLLNTVKPRRPEWLSVKVQSDFEQYLATLVDARVRAMAVAGGGPL